MSESDGEQAARSLALEQAYVHEVYEQCAERTVQGKHWPRIYQFLQDLEPGALVCDIGCGNGKYLNVNQNIFKIGADRCQKFTNIAREKENEVLTCDNLSLPFRDESFDAVLSIAVVHHFSTTERRVNAIKELARVLRIGGRLIISVWAMEQKHRKFESQDVLVPWPKAYCVSSNGSPMKPRGMSYDERTRGKHAQTYLLTKGSQRKGSKNKGYWIDPIFSPSPSTSSLSSPNETCYSFFRRALQKLAGGRRGSRAWFLENWQNGKERHNYSNEDDDDADVDDLPIELRRLEEHPTAIASEKRPSNTSSSDNNQNNNSNNLTAEQRRQQMRQQSSDSLSFKSKSLSSITDAQRQDLVRSRSSLPGLSCNAAVNTSGAVAATAATAGGVQEHAQLQQQGSVSSGTSVAVGPTTVKPRLVKQKSHLNDDACLDVPENTAIQNILRDIPELQVPSSSSGKRGNVHKQSSMNEELMSIERLKERESVRANIMKQASLNEELIYNSRPTLETLRDTFYSTSASKRFQLLKSGLTNRIKQSTTNIEKVSGMAIKNGFVRILQSWKSTESPTSTTPTTTTTSADPAKVQPKRDGPEGIERRLSREDGSDSSKDSSLQSDTSVDSEDSFASVIYVPKKNSSPLIETICPPSVNLHLNTTSAPPSPRVKYAPDLSGSHRMKLISISPLLKQFPATSKSLPPPSPPGLSPRTLNSANMRPFFSGNEVNQQQQQHQQQQGSTASLMERIAEVKRSFDSQPLPRIPSMADSKQQQIEKKTDAADASTAEAPEEAPAVEPARLTIEERQETHRRPSLQSLHEHKPLRGSPGDSDDEQETVDNEDTSPLITPDPIDEALEELSEKSLTSSSSTSTTTPSTEEDDSRRSRLNQIKQLLQQKPGFATRTRPAFPIVRRASTATGKLETVTKVLPRLLSLELFNPETDDLDSDSSGVSSPESVGSVISVISDERYISKKEAENASKSEENSSGDGTDSSKDMASMSCSTKPDDLSSGDTETSQKSSTSDSDSLSAGSPQSSKLLEAAASVVSSLENAVGALIQRKSDEAATKTSAKTTTPPRPTALDTHISPIESTWNEECNRHLIDLTDRLSSNLKNENEQFSFKTKLDDDPLASVRYTSSYLKQQQQQHQTRSDLDNNGHPSSDDNRPTKLSSYERSCSEESDASSGFVVVSSSGEFANERGVEHQRSLRRRPGRFGNSIESSDIGDSISETSSSLNTRRFCTGSTASLASSSLTNTDRQRLCPQTRSASEEIPVRRTLQPSRRSATSASNGTLSGSSSQESLPADQMTYHQYYHVFREGELDQLINKYVENLHIISSYYDHASWCIVAEKVQVWTI